MKSHRKPTSYNRRHNRHSLIWQRHNNKESVQRLAHLIEERGARRCVVPPDVRRHLRRVVVCFLLLLWPSRLGQDTREGFAGCSESQQ
jgi:hypothetical protein